MNGRIIQVGLAACFLVLAATTPSAQKTTAEALFREALVKERAEGTLKEAVFRYERIIADFGRERQVAAQAMYQLALIYEKLGDPRATVLLTRLTRNYAGVEPYATRARERLRALQNEPPSPFPAVVLDKDFELGSPDGKLVVYHKSPKEWGRLYVKDLASGKERVLVDHGPASVSNLAWSPDSRQLAYNLIDSTSKVNEIRIVQADGSATTSLGVRGYPTAWTTTNEIFCYWPNFKGGSADWLLVPAGGGTPRKIISVPIAEGNYLPAITPDATRLIVSRSKKLFVQNVGADQVTPLTTGTGEESWAEISANGQLVAFQANLDGRWGIYVAPLDRGLPVANPVRLARLEEPTISAGGWAGRAWWTRDGLLTLRIEHTRSDLYRIEMDPRSGRATDRPVRLTQDAADNRLPTISPDGRRVAYWFRNGTKAGLAVMNADGTNERPLVEQPLVLRVSWRSPDEILYRRARPSETGAIPVVSLNLETGIEQPVARPEGVYWWYVPDRREILHLYPGAGGPRAGATLKARSIAEDTDRVVAQIDYLAPLLSLTPDGRRIAYLTYGPVEGSTQPVAELALMSIDGKPEGVLIPAQREGFGPMAWSPDGRYLLIKYDSKGPFVMNVATRESWPLCRDASDAEFCGGLDARGSWSPDGTFVVVGRTEPSRVERLAWEGVTADAVARLMQRR